MWLGQGVFAAREIRRRQIIGEIRGTLIRDPYYTSDYCIDMGGGVALEPIGAFRYLNHCCDPNCELFSIDDPAADEDRLWLQALVDIHPGQQLTIDYAWSAAGAIPCACQSPLCRGWIVRPDELPLVLAEAAGEGSGFRVQGSVGEVARLQGELAYEASTRLRFRRSPEP